MGVLKLLCDYFDVDVQIPHPVAQVLVACCGIHVPSHLRRFKTRPCPYDCLSLRTYYLIDLFLLLSEAVLLLNQHTPQLANDSAW